MRELCRVPFCDSEIRSKAKRLCNSHYLLWTRHRRLRHVRRKKGSGTFGHSAGYFMVNQQYEHRTVAEKAIGKKLPRGAVVHHLDGNKLNNTKSNLVICQDHAYHKLLHRRQDALESVGDANALKCSNCGKYGKRESMYEYRTSSRNGYRYRHKIKSGKCQGQIVAKSHK